MSEPDKVIIGVPWGTILSPALLLIHSGSLFRFENEGNIFNIAQDTVILYTAHREFLLGCRIYSALFKRAWLNLYCEKVQFGKCLVVYCSRAAAFSRQNFQKQEK